MRSSEDNTCCVVRTGELTTNSTNTLKILKTLSGAPTAGPASKAPATTTTGKAPASSKSQIPDCCICLFGVTIRQALFIAPCSHTFHYKCIRPLLETHHPAFSCPLCRTFADLEEDVEIEVELDDDDDDESVNVAEGTPALGADIEPVVTRVSGVEEEPEAEAEDLDEIMADGRGGIDSEGSGSGDGARGDSPELVLGAELGEVGDSDEMDVDGTVGGKRKR